MGRPVDDSRMWDSFVKDKAKEHEKYVNDMIIAFEKGEVTKQQLIEEGIWDRMAARRSAAKETGFKGTAKAIGKKALGGVLGKVGAPKAAEELTTSGLSTGFDPKTLTLINRHVLKLEKAAADLQNDVEKLGLNNPEVQKQHPEITKALASLTQVMNYMKSAFEPTKGVVGTKAAEVGDYQGGSTVGKRTASDIKRYTPKWAGGGELVQTPGSTGTPAPKPPPVPAYAKKKTKKKSKTATNSGQVLGPTSR